MHQRFTSALCALVVLFAASAARAATVFVGDGSVGTGNTGVSYTGTLDFNSVSGVLTITLTNTTDPASIGGYLTGFVFNVAGAFGPGTAVLASASNSSFLDVTVGSKPKDPPFSREDASPFGSFEAGAAVGANFTGGGNPTVGIPVGGSATFTFNVTGSGVGALTDLSFLSENGIHPPGSSDAFFVARFKGLANGDSDKVVPGTLIPLPASVWGGLALLAVLGGCKLRARRLA